MLERFSRFRLVLDDRSRKYVAVILFIAFVAAMFDIVGIGMIMPFVAVASNPEYIMANQFLLFCFESYDFSSVMEFVRCFSVVLVLFYILRFAVLNIYHYYLARFSFGRFHYFAHKLFSVYFDKSFSPQNMKSHEKESTHINHSSEILSKMLLAFVELVFEVVVLIGLVVLLFLTHWKLAILLLVLLFLYTKASQRLRDYKDHQNKSLEQYGSRFSATLEQSIKNTRIIKLYTADRMIVDEFEKQSRGYARANITNFSSSNILKSGAEWFVITMAIVTIMYILSKAPNASHIVPVMMMFAMAMYRIVPTINKIVSDFGFISTNIRVIDDVYDAMTKSEKLVAQEIKFDRALKLDRVTFGYSDKWSILYNFGFLIKKGQKIAISGDDASGRSAIVELLSGVYLPKEGNFYVDDVDIDASNAKAWRAHVGYVAKPTFIFDANTRENIIFDTICDEAKMNKLLEDVQISEFLASKNGIETDIGHDGVKISGGQKFKIGLARALYNSSDFVIVDELESGALSEADSALLQELFFGKYVDKTVLFAVSDKNIAKKCDVVFQMEKGMLYKITKESLE